MKPISADSHVVEGPDVFTGLAERFGDQAPRLMSVGDQADCIVIPERSPRGINVAQMGMAATRLSRKSPLQRKPGHKPDVANMQDPELIELFAKGYQGMRAGLRDGAQRYQDQDADGIAAEFLYPGFFPMFNFPNVELLVAIQKNYNDWLHDYATAAKSRLYGLAAIPLQDPVAGRDELERVIKLGFKGGCIPCTSPADRPYFDLAYEPIWGLAEEAGFPLSMHVGCNAYLPKSQRGAKLPRDSIVDYAGSQATVQRTIVELMCRGVCERHPQLKIVVAEFNAGWIAHWLERVDQGLQRELRQTTEPYRGASPQEIWNRQFYATLEDDLPALLTRHLIGESNLMWGSDYPHTDSTWPYSQDVLTEIFQDFGDAVKAKITHDNVKHLYQI